MIEIPTIHATAVLLGAKAVLIRGPAGSGKSRFALSLIEAAESGRLPFARLVADDRCHLEAVSDRLLVRPAAELAGLIEVRGLGIRALPYEAVAVLARIVDLAQNIGPRMPDDAEQRDIIAGVTLPRMGVPPGADALAMLLASLRTTARD
ncbi:MAG: HPr kinase/phosphorylase [Pseudolabrys sp.]